MGDSAGTKSILLVNDMAGYGKVALSAMIPILSHMRHQVYNLPTALVSNTLDYGVFDILETTGYMRRAIDAWDELGFSFDAVATGFLVSEEQTRLVRDFCRASRNGGARVFVDPIMGDEGSLYNGVTEQTVGYMREMCGVAHLVMPNFTEAAFLAGMFSDRVTDPAGLSRAEAGDLARAVAALGAESVVVTSCVVEGEHATLVLERGGELSVLPYDEVPVRFPGTGDIFSSVLIGHLLSGARLADATQLAMDAVRGLMLENRDQPDAFKGIPIELYLDRIAVPEGPVAAPVPAAVPFQPVAPVREPRAAEGR